MSPPPPPSPGRRAPPLGSTEQPPPLPFALQPPKKRWVWLWRNQCEATASVPTPRPVVPQIHATPAAAGAAATNPLAAPALLADAAALSPAAVGQKRSSPLPPLAGDHKHHASPPPAAAEGKPSTPPPCKRDRKVVRRVRKVVKKIVPKGTTSAVARKETTNNAAEAASATGAAGATLLQAADEEAVADDEQEPGEFIPEKTAADWNNADAARQPFLGEEEAAGEEAAAVAGEPEAEKKLVSSNEGEERAVTGRHNRMREVFIGALHWDAKEEDVRAALGEAGEITEVRIIMDAETTTKNRGYCFVRYREPAQARKAIEELGNVKICGRPCRIQALEGNGKAKLAQRDSFEDYTHIHYGDTRPPLPMGGNSYRMNDNPHARNRSNAYAMETSRYGVVPHPIGGYSPLYHHGSIMYLPDSNYYGLAEPWDGIPMSRSGSRGPGQPHGRRH